MGAPLPPPIYYFPVKKEFIDVIESLGHGKDGKNVNSPTT